MVISFGYRYLPQANGAPAINRIEPVVTFSFPMKGAFLLTDKNRADLDWQNGGFEWHYRNRFQVERALTIRSYHPAPVVRTHPLICIQLDEWRRLAVIEAGESQRQTPLSLPKKRFGEPSKSAKRTRIIHRPR
jgi:hypothetical protein